MNVIFLTMSQIRDISNRGIYTDLIRGFRDEGHNIYIVTPYERRIGKTSELVEDGCIHLLGVQTLNLQKTNTIEKGIGQVMVERQYKNAIKQFLFGIRFDLILYSTPPISFPKVVDYLKQENPGAKSYLLLKDIFPQNAVDLGMMSENGPKGILYNYFRRKEKRLYRVSDYIGCMSPANVRYLLSNNPEISPSCVEVAPNSVELITPQRIDRDYVREKYNLPIEKPVFIYGGNLGKPQGVDFLIQCLMALSSRTDCHFVVIGSGTEFPKLKRWFEEFHPASVTVMAGLPKDEYDELVGACDVGLIFLDHRFTIPNYPSRLLAYLENRMPIIAATDPITDIGSIAVENGYGYWCESNDVQAFVSCVNKMLESDIKAMGERGYEFLKNNYLVEHTYSQIMKHFQ